MDPRLDTPATPAPVRAPRRKPKPSRVVAPKAQKPLARREPWPQRLKGLFDASPAYGIAVSVHVVLLLVLSFWTIATYHRREVAPVQARIGTSTELVMEEVEQTHALSDMLEAPDLDVEISSDDPFHEALGADVGPLRADDAAIGLAGARGGGKGRGGQASQRGGPTSASEGAVHLGLEWLAGHRTSQGVWHQLPADHLRSGRIGQGGEVARTGLAILCFLAAGQDQVRAGPYRELVADALSWLTKQVDSRGQFVVPNVGHAQFYHQAIGTLALAEALALEQRKGTRRSKLRQAVARSVGYLERTREPGFAWRYRPKLDTDTSVTSWVTLALKSAEAAGVAVDPACFQGVRDYLEQVTTEQGTTGYTTATDSRPAMTATGLFLRIMLGESPTTARNRAAAERVARNRVTITPGGSRNFYGIYYAALALYQIGGSTWERFNPQVRDALIGGQRRGGGHQAGSWPHGGYMNDPVLATTFAILTLETYYRYLPVHDGVEAEDDPRSPAEAKFDEAAVLMSEARERGDGGSWLVAEAAFEQVLGLLGDEADVEATLDLELEVRAYLVEVALLQEDEPLVLRRAQQYLDAVPPGQRGDPAIRRLALLGAYKELMAEAKRVFAPGREPAEPELDGLRRAVEGLQERLARERNRLGNHVQDVVDTIAPGLDQLAMRLDFEGDPERALIEGLAAIETRPARGPVDPREVRVLTGLLRRAHGQFQLAAEAADRTAFVEGERDLERVRARDLDRLEPSQQRVVGPLYRQVMLSRLGGLLGLGLSQQVLQGIAAYRVVHEGHDERALDGLERAALAAEDAAGRLTPEQRARLDALILAWAQSDPLLDVNARLVVADALRAAGQTDEAARHYAQVLVPAATPGQAHAARLALAEIRRGQGDLAAAERHLDAIEGGARQTFDYRFERSALLRAQGRPHDALTEYASLLRALGEAHPEQWWQVAEAMAFTFGEADDVAGGTRLLEDMRRRDPTFGGDEARKERLSDLLFEFLKRG